MPEKTMPSGWVLTGRYRHTRGWFARVKVEVEETRRIYSASKSRLPQPLWSETRWRRATPADLEMDVFTREVPEHG